MKHLKLIAVVLLAAVGAIRAYADDATGGYQILVNGNTLQMKVVYMFLTSRTMFGADMPCVALRMEIDGDTLSQESKRYDYLYVHPIVCQVVFADIATGAKDMRIDEIMNPTADELRFSGLGEGQQVLVYSISGRLCLNTRAEAGSDVVGLQGLPRDVYVIKAGDRVFKYVKR